jgi:hypothetical protein
VTVNVKARTGPAAPGRHHPRGARLSVETSTPGQDAVPRCRRRSRGPYAAVVDVWAVESFRGSLYQLADSFAASFCAFASRNVTGSRLFTKNTHNGPEP